MKMPEEKAILEILKEAKKLAQQYRALTGKPLGITGGVKSPCHFHQRGEMLVVPDPRAVFVDLLIQLAENPGFSFFTTIVERSPVTVMPVLDGFWAGATLTVSATLLPTSTELGFAEP